MNSVSDEDGVLRIQLELLHVLSSERDFRAASGSGVTLDQKEATSNAADIHNGIKQRLGR